MAADGSHPVFCIHEAGSTTHGGIWSQQLQMLLTHKMAEISRVMFVHQMLNDSQTDTALTQRVWWINGSMNGWTDRQKWMDGQTMDR